MVASAPRFRVVDAERIARETFGLKGLAAALTSERDQNFLMTEGHEPQVVLKIANGSESADFLTAQRSAMRHLSASAETDFAALFPRVRPTSDGRDSAETEGPDGCTNEVWAVSYLAGRPLASVMYRPPALLESIGEVAARIREAFANFDHPALHRDFYWDIAKARDTAAADAPLVADASTRRAIERLVAEYDATVASTVARLPCAVIHGDLHEHNILVTGSAASGDLRISGIVDFGDMVHTVAIGDLAIACAYVACGARDPLGEICRVVAGYARVHQPTDDELSAIFPLAAMRLCASAAIAARQTRANPENAYLDISQRAIAATLPLLATTPFELASAMIRPAAGVSVSKDGAATRASQWIREQSGFAPVMAYDLASGSCVALPLSPSSPLVSGDPDANAEPLLNERIFSFMDVQGAAVGAGGYLEPRFLYGSPLFAASADVRGDVEDRRTIHLGVDLFAQADTPIFAALDGVVHAFADNRALLDYGPVIILRHEPAPGVAFHTLYGHLSRASLNGLEIGKPVRGGDQIATLGTADVNGGWVPHLHLQIIVDLMGKGTDFPGVARPTEADFWAEVCPDPNLLMRIPDQRIAVGPPRHDEPSRSAHIGQSVRLSYRHPIRVTRGWMQHLWDDRARRYLDGYNNVPHVGHSHPRVVEAIAQQAAILNTNTRYVTDVVDEYAERLTGTLPAGLDVCFLLNSASEANELAIRLARQVTGRRGVVVLEAAYHGNTNTLIDISPYKHAGPGGHGAPPWVRVAPIPDDYRGEFKRGNPRAGTGFAESVRLAAADLESEGGVCAFIAETCPSVGGQIMMPPGYLAAAYAHVRAAGGVCIADEVQTGLGRIGTHTWAFQAHDVTPDIVVMGKPLGNGHPLAAVVTTRAIADAFDNGMEFFSTFGGNTVACAAGLAVLNVMRDEQLQANALRVGAEMLKVLRSFADRFPIVGDVRGSGFFLGVELVRDRETLEPADVEASFVVNRMREIGVLVGTDGPHHNVIKIRPPMVFDGENADRLVGVLERALQGL